MLYIRTDGNAVIGTGHVMRCLSIANACRRAGSDCTFITADEHFKPLIDEQGFRVICLNTVWNELDREIEQMEKLIIDTGIKKLLVDSYFVTADYLSRLDKLTHIIYIDDLNEFTYPCSELICYNIFASKIDYPARYPNTKLLLGCHYAPLREEFQNIPKRVPRDDVQSVLITTGGGDNYNIACKLVNMTQKTPELSGVEVHIAVGRYYMYLDELNSLDNVYDNVTLHKDVKKMSHLMTSCDITVSAGGSTLYELCACGSPTVAFTLADNQFAGVEAFGDGYFINAGDIRENEELCLKRIGEGIIRLASDYSIRSDFTRKGQELVDGRGAIRIAKEVMK